MGSCATNNHITETKYHIKQFESLQQQHLKLMYIDLSSRSLTQGITREQFDIFFHLNGLWSASMYKKFDKDKKGYISFDQFSNNLLIMTKGNFNQKSQVLFELYNDGQNSGVTFPMLTKMFYSYPKEQINRMVVEEKFLKSIDSYQLACFFNKQKKIKDNITLQALQKQDWKSTQDQELMPSSQQMKKMRSEWIDSRNSSTQQVISSDKSFQKHDMFLKSMPIKAKYMFESQKQVKVRKNSCDDEKLLNNRRFKLTANITFLVKKYVHFLFKTFNVDIQTGKLNLEQFRTLLRNHEKIFDVYFEGFHTQVWQYNEQGLPLYKSMPVNFESEVIQRNKSSRIPRYLILIKNTLFVFNNKNQSKPLQIKNLQGLYVKDVQSYQFVISIFHRDGIYPQQQYVLNTNELKQQWLNHLNDFVKGNINDEFELIETVGAGKFAKVYYGKQKNTQQEVAIKYIEKNKLSKYERDSIQKECSILQLCHHPYIIKFIKHYQTKNNVYIITEYLNQGDLFQYVKERIFLEEYQAALIFKQIIEAVQYLSQLGLIHRDLKPQNIMIQLNQHKNMVKKIKVIDFGFAIFKKELQFMPEGQKFAGTPGYMAPEVLNGQSFDQGADMFSLGIILYFMLSGYLPFYSPIYEQIVQQTKLCNITLRNSHWSNVSKEAKHLVEGLLTFKEERLTLNEVIQHDWLKDIENLKQYHGMNRRSKKK